MEMPPRTPPTTGNFSPTSRQPRAMKLGIQAQLNLLIKVGQEKVGSPDPYPTLPYFSYFPYPNLKNPQSGVYLKPAVMLTLTYPYLCYT